MRRRSTALNYALSLLTAGQFGVAWLFLMAADVNSEKPGYVPRLRAFAIGFAILYVVYLLCAGYDMYLIGTATTETYQMHGARLIPMAPLFLIGVGLATYTIYLLVKIGTFVREKGGRLPGNFVLVLLLFVYLITLPLLQTRLNKL